ncbi:Virulence-associated protein E [Candidatus Propionivibrio aalborgensis]|uniref:Virulence-associated protein E n=1 Tax=Candidatus Propionivibrio aalborgensis TaxID=1860101 RepID=A0A1A8XJL2_9RHOO|nr:DNA primase [Candidatus Propionivibrio aalborgensis]SBT04582.1 Virulence-associated protein E [Candidatus Propionivibrio aalborgensis]
MSNVHNILSHLDRVKQTRPDSWQAQCPAHDDRGPSLSIRETDDGRVLLHCFAGCSVHDVLAAVGLDISDLFPPREIQQGKPERRPFPAADVLRAIGFEALVVASAGASLLAGEPFSAVDRERLIQAVARIQSALTAAGVRYA